MSASRVLPTTPFQARIRTAWVPFQIMVRESIGLASLHTKGVVGASGIWQVLFSARLQTGGLSNRKSLLGLLLSSGGLYSVGGTGTLQSPRSGSAVSTVTMYRVMLVPPASATSSPVNA